MPEIMNVKNVSVIELYKGVPNPSSIARALKFPPKTVDSIIVRFKKTGQVDKKVESGRRRIVRTPALDEATRGRIKWNPIQSMRKMAKELNVGPTKVRRVVKYDLKAKTKIQLINESCKLRRLQRCKKLWSALKSGAPVILFSD